MNKWLRLLLKCVFYPFYLERHFVFNVWRPFYHDLFAEELEFVRDKKTVWYNDLGSLNVINLDKLRSGVGLTSLDRKRVEILNKWGWKCFLCGIESCLTIDHFVIKFSVLIKENKGRWFDYLNNCRPLCVECHLKKDNRKF